MVKLFKTEDFQPRCHDSTGRQPSTATMPEVCRQKVSRQKPCPGSSENVKEHIICSDPVRAQMQNGNPFVVGVQKVRKNIWSSVWLRLWFELLGCIRTTIMSLEITAGYVCDPQLLNTADELNTLSTQMFALVQLPVCFIQACYVLPLIIIH